VTTISCVGDSITAGGWPQIMQASLNAKYPGKYNVINFGECGSTMQRGADSPYVKRASWPRVLNTSAQVLVIMLGTNDSKDKSDGGVPNWENDGVTGQAEYVADYAWMIEQFKTQIPGGAPDIYATIVGLAPARPPRARARPNPLPSSRDSPSRITSRVCTE